MICKGEYEENWLSSDSDSDSDMLDVNKDKVYWFLLMRKVYKWLINYCFFWNFIYLLCNVFLIKNFIYIVLGYYNYVLVIKWCDICIM